MTRHLGARLLICIGIVALACEIRVREAGEGAARRTRLALRVSVERAIAQPRPFIAGKAEGIKGPERVRRHACDKRQPKCGESERKYGDNRESNSSAHSILQSRERARDVVTRACCIHRVIDNGTHENTCFRGFPARAGKSSLMKRDPLARTVASRLQQFRRALL